MRSAGYKTSICEFTHTNTRTHTCQCVVLCGHPYLDFFIALTHSSSVEDLKREHELDKQHLINLHRQEVEALKAAHSHTR